MVLEEAKRIRKILAKLKLCCESVVLDIGSSSEKFRCVDQPYIDYYVFRPLRKIGAKIIHIDIKKEKGVDIVCDLASSETEELIKTIPPADVVLCTSLLEHVNNREIVLSRIRNLTKPGGTIILTVPYVFHYHPDPIDTGYRPSNTELECLFPKEQYTILTSEILEAYSYPSAIKQNLFAKILNKVLRKFNFEGKCKRYIVIPSKISLVVVKKNR